MKRIGIIVVSVFCLVAGSSFGQNGSIFEIEELDSLKALKHGLWNDGIDGSYFGGKLELPDVYQHSIPDSLMKFYQNDLPLPENRFYYRYDKKPGYPVPESPIPRYYDRGIPYYDRMPSQPNDKRSVPVPGFPGWKVQEIMMKSERS